MQIGLSPIRLTLTNWCNRGVKFDQAPKRTLEESIDHLFSTAKDHAIERAKQLPALPEMPYAVASLYGEIITCIIFGVYGAAITLSGILIEFVLKHCTYLREAGGYSDEFPDVNTEANLLATARGTAPNVTGTLWSIRVPDDPPTL
jgi:hypothetical protein